MEKLKQIIEWKEFPSLEWKESKRSFWDLASEFRVKTEEEGK